VDEADLIGKQITDARTGEILATAEARRRYEAHDFEDHLLMTERVAAMCRDLFQHLIATGGPEQKTIVFCARDRHADEVAAAMNNLYAAWCAALVGRGTRIDLPTGKLMFRVYDYTDATRLFGETFRSRFAPPRKASAKAPGIDSPPPEKTLLVEGFDVRVTDAGRYMVTSVDGKAMPVTVEEYKQCLAERLVEEAPTLEDFRTRWISPPERRELMGRLPDAGRAPLLVRTLEDMMDYDLYDVLAELGYGLAPRTRPQRAEAFTYKHERWLPTLPSPATATLKALAGQFARSGTDGLENPQVFETPDVTRAGGLPALRALGQPAEILPQTKERLFAA
jgi:type I restriction enzyme R subunit